MVLLSQSAFRCCWQNAWKNKGGALSWLTLSEVSVHGTWAPLGQSHAETEGTGLVCVVKGGASLCDGRKRYPETRSGSRTWLWRASSQRSSPSWVQVPKGPIPSSKAITLYVRRSVHPQLTSEPSTLNHVPKHPYVDMLNWGPSQREFLRESTNSNYNI